MSSVEAYSSALNGSSGNSAPVGGPMGGRRRSRKLRLVKKKTVRRMLAQRGLKMRGGGDGTEGTDGMEGGRRRRRTRRRRHSLFHF
jgi:hypothetical protein